MAYPVHGLSLSQLRYLVALADLGHFRRAAEACHVSQPTLSVQIQKLEATLGIALFERRATRVQPTRVGQEIIERSRRLLLAVGEIVDVAKSRKSPFSEPLHLGVIPTLGAYVLPWLMPPLQRAYPQMQFVVQEDLTGHLLPQLKDRHLDALLLALPVREGDLECAPLFDEPFWFLCPIDDPLAKLAHIGEADLAGHRLLLLAEGHCFRDQALAVCGRHFPEPLGGDFRATSLETLKQLVSIGLGCTLLPALAAGQMSNKEAGVTIRPFAARDAFRRIGLVWRRSFPRANEMQELATLIRQHVPKELTAVSDSSQPRTPERPLVSAKVASPKSAKGWNVC
jgi:LysR family hydrogen peroxide-inducible transcriptional activator